MLCSLYQTVFKVECFHLADYIKHNCVPLRTLLCVKDFFSFLFSVMVSNP